MDAADHPTAFDYLYPDDAPIADKIEAIAKVPTAPTALSARLRGERHQALRRPRASAPCRSAWRRRTPLSHDPELLNAPTGFTVPVRAVRAYTGAGWLVALAATCRRCPASATPAAFNVDIDDEGRTVGLF